MQLEGVLAAQMAVAEALDHDWELQQRGLQKSMKIHDTGGMSTTYSAMVVKAAIVLLIFGRVV